MVKVLEGKHSNSRKCGVREKGGLAGLARLRHECHRYREEVVCIRTFPRMQLRWPALARLEIGNESSEEDASSVWDATEAEKQETQFNSRETEGFSGTCAGNAMEFAPKLASLHIASKADEGTSDDKFRGFEVKERSLQDVQNSQKMEDYPEFNDGCDDIAPIRECGIDTIEENSLKSHGPLDGTLRSKLSPQMSSVTQTSDPSGNEMSLGDGTLVSRMSHRMLELSSSVKRTPDHSANGSSLDSLKGQTLDTSHLHSDTGIDATAHFTANPHCNDLELSPCCSLDSNFTCPIETFKLVAFPGSNASENANCKEREVWSEQVLCSCPESHICSSAELNGYATLEKRTQTSTPIGTNSPDLEGRTFDESFLTFQAQPERRLLTSLHLVAPTCSSGAGHDWDYGQAKASLHGPENRFAALDACHLFPGQGQNVLGNGKQNGLAIHTSNSPGYYGILTYSGGNPLRTTADYLQSMNMESQSGFAEGKQKHETLSSDDSGGFRRNSTPLMSGLALTSNVPSPRSVQHRSSSLLSNETRPPGSPKKEGTGCLGLISLSGMKNFARLGVGSTRDSVMTAQMAKRIKHALERLGDVGIQGKRHKKSVSIKKGKWTDEIYAKWKNNSIVSDLKKYNNSEELFRNPESEKSHSHFDNARENGEQNLGSGQVIKENREATSVTPEEPDLYLQSIIAALDSTYESTLKASASASGLQMDQRCPSQAWDAGEYTKSSKTHAKGTSLTTLEKVSESHANKDCVYDYKIEHTTDIAIPDDVLAENYSADYVNSIRELISRPYHREDEQDTVGKDCGVSRIKLAKSNGSPLSLPGQELDLDSNKDPVGIHKILQSLNGEEADTALQEKRPAIDVCSMGEIRPPPSSTDERPAAVVTTEDSPAFTVHIDAPPGSCFQVQAGGHPTLYVEVEEANRTVLCNPTTYPPSPAGRQGKFNLRIAHRKSRLLQHRSLFQHPPLTRQDRAIEPVRHDSNRLPASIKAEEGRQTEQPSLSSLKLSPPVVCPDDSMSPNYSPTMRPTTQENLRHSFDKKITSLVKKANQLQEEASLPGTSTHKRHSSMCRHRPLEVRKVQRPSILKPSVTMKTLPLDNSTCSRHRDTQTPPKKMKGRPFGAAAAGLAHELNVLMKDRRSGQESESRALNKRKVAFASPEAYELGPRSTSKPSTSQSGMQGEPFKLKHSTQSPTSHSKAAWHDDTAPSVTKTECEFRKTKEQQMEPLSKQRMAPRHPQLLQKVSVGKNYEIQDAVSASPLSGSRKNQASRETSWRTEQSEGGETRATKVVDASTAETFDYDQFRQELKDLQAERMKLESLVHTIFITEPDPEGKTEDKSARHVQKNLDSIIKSARRYQCGEDHEKRKGRGQFSIRESGKNGPQHTSTIANKETKTGSSLAWVTLSDDTLGKTITRNTQTKGITKTNNRFGSTVDEEDSKRTPNACFPSGDALKLDSQDAKNGHRELPVAGSDSPPQEKDHNIGFSGKPESEKHLSANLRALSTEVILERFPNLNNILAGAATSAMPSAYPASKTQVAKPDFFKEYLLQALDSSMLLLQHCVDHSAIPIRSEASKMHQSADLVPNDSIMDNDYNVGKCTQGLSDRITEVIVIDDVKVPARQDEAGGHSQEQLSKLDPNVQLLRQDECHWKPGDEAHQHLLKPQKGAVISQQTVKSGEPQAENTALDIRKDFERSQDSDSKVSSSEKDTSWSGSLKSVMEAYEEAQRTAALLMSASPQVLKSKGGPPSSPRPEQSDKLQRAEKPKLQMDRMPRRKEKVSPLTLLEKAEKAEAKEMKLRFAQKKYLKSKQNPLRSTGVGIGKEKSQGRLRKHHSGREQRKVPTLIYRTAKFGTKTRDDWNNSTEISYEKGRRDWNTNAKDAAQALVTKVLNEEFLRKRGLPRVKQSKQVEPDLRRKRKDFVNLESYSSTIAKMRVREKPSMTKGNPPIENTGGAGETEGIHGSMYTERSSSQSIERNDTDRVDYLTINRNLLETQNHVLDESTMVFKRSGECAEKLNSKSGDNLINPEFRESIEHWLDLSGGFEFLDSYNEIGENYIFERQESKNFMPKNTNTFSMMTELSERNLSNESCPVDNLCFPGPEMEGRSLSTSKTTSSEIIGNSPTGDFGNASSGAVRNAIQRSPIKYEEFPHKAGAGHEDDHAGGCSAESSSISGKYLLGCSFGILKDSGSNQFVEEFPSQEPSQMGSVDNGKVLLFSEDRTRSGGSVCPSQGDHRICENAHSMSPKLAMKEAHSDPLLQGTELEEKWTEEQELELALLEIVLQTVLKVDPLSETVATMTSGLPSAPAGSHSRGSSVSPSKVCPNNTCFVLPIPTGGLTPISSDEEGLLNRVHLEQKVQTSIRELSSLPFLAQDHGGNSAKSSGGDWPEYECVAEMQSGSQSLEEDEHWPEYNGVDEVEDGADQGTQVEDSPSDQISTLSTSEVDTDEKPPGGTLPVSVSTRPPYSAVHSVRAAERQSIDFPGIASLAFGYPSPRPPPSKPLDQTSVDRNSVSVQTADMLTTQSAPPNTSVCVLPYYYLPPLSMYLPHSSTYGLPFPANTVPMAVQGQPSSQFIASQYASGVFSTFPPSCMFPPSPSFPQVVTQTTVMPVAPVVQSCQQTPVPACTTEPAQLPVSIPPLPPSLHPVATEGPSHPATTVKLAATSTPKITSHTQTIFLDVAGDSHSSSDSCRSSLATPSTILSSPEHESRVASALARPRIARGIVGQLFKQGSSDEGDTYGREEISHSEQDRVTQRSDHATHLPPHITADQEAEDPQLQSIIAENSYKQSRSEITQALDSVPAHVFNASDFILNQHAGRNDQHEPGTSESLDCARSSVLVASCECSGSSDGIVQRTRGKASVASAQPNLHRFRRNKHRSPRPAGQVGFSQTSSRSSGEIVDASGISSHALADNQKSWRHLSLQSLPLSEGEVEAGQMPSEGEYFGPVPHAWGHHHPRFLLNRHTGGRVTTPELGEVCKQTPEPGEVCKQAFMKLRPPRSEIEGQSSVSESLSEGELRVEPGEVRADSKSPESEGTTGDLAK